MNASRAEIEQAIVNTVSYVDAFDYPLTPAEIHRYLVGLSLPVSDVIEHLHSSALVPRRLSRRDEFYMLPGREIVSQVRQERRAVAERLWPEAVRYGLLMARMPFVRMVAVTGSLAVNNVGTEEDVDYFVVTADDHLWVCRAFVILIVRAAARRGLVLCPNYFLAESAIHLAEQNLYTAHEMAQMVPLFGSPVYNRLRRANSWLYQYLPNALGAPALPAHVQCVMRQASHLSSRRLLEAIIDTKPGRWLDRWEMARKVRKFRQAHHPWKEAEFSANKCKGHFNLHQQRAIQAYERLISNPNPVDSFEAEPSLRVPV
jgi:hypothetical protein